MSEIKQHVFEFQSSVSLGIAGARLLVTNMFPNIMHSLSLRAPAESNEKNKAHPSAFLILVCFFPLPTCFLVSISDFFF